MLHVGLDLSRHRLDVYLLGEDGGRSRRQRRRPIATGCEASSPESLKRILDKRSSRSSSR
jgi:hypothetical protein